MRDCINQSRLYKARGTSVKDRAKNGASKRAGRGGEERYLSARSISRTAKTKKSVPRYTASSLLFFFARLLHANPKHVSCELSREPREMTSWFAIALDEIRTRRISREKADCKQSSSSVFLCSETKRKRLLRRLTNTILSYFIYLFFHF